MRANEFHSGVAGECLFSSCVRAPSSKVLRLALAVCLALVTVETVSARPKQAARRTSRRAAGRSFRPADGSVTKPAAAAAPACLACLQAIADQQRGRPHPQLPALVCPQCGPRQQPHHQFAPSTRAPVRTLTRESIATSARA